MVLLEAFILKPPVVNGVKGGGPGQYISFVDSEIKISESNPGEDKPSCSNGGHINLPLSDKGYFFRKNSC